MKILNSIIVLSVVVLGTAFAGCSDDKELIPLTKTEGSVQKSSYSSLTFKWSKVEGARQYSCQLKETATDLPVSTEVTQSNSITYGDLRPSTDYTLTVLAYAAMESGHTTSEPLILTGRTADIQPLATPVVTMTREVNSLIFEWDYIESAYSYLWTLVDGEGTVVQEGETRGSEVSIDNLASGSYIFTLTATTDIEGLKNSEASETKFDFVRQRLEVWTANGAYTSELLGGAQWTATLTAYDDNSYTISGWYGDEGTDLNFKIDPQDVDNMFKLSAEDYAYNAANGSYAVPTGIDDLATVYVTPGNNRCAFEGTAGSGIVTLTVSDGTESAVDEFVWGLTIDDICGEWVMHTKCMADMEEYDEDYDDVRDITITKIDETTVEFPLPYYADYWVRAKVDLGAGTLTIDPTPYVGHYGYTFANYSNQEAPVVATISKNRINLTDWTYWLLYADVWYKYTQGPGTAEFTRP